MSLPYLQSLSPLFIFTLFWLLDSSNSTSHIRFDSGESDEETFEEQHEVSSMKDITDDLNSTPPSSNIAASKQNHQASPEKAVTECKVMEYLNLWSLYD